MPYTSPNVETWQGSGSFFPQNFTPFGFYDNDPDFQCDAESIAVWCGYRLGFPVVDVELQQVNFYAAFEEAVSEYGTQVNIFQARDNLLNLQGQSTGSNINLSGKLLPNTLRGIIRLAKDYGTEVGAGGLNSYYTGSIQLEPGRQIYDFTRDSTLETGSFSTNSITIRKIYHVRSPAVTRFLDPALGAGLGGQQLLEQFNFGAYTVPGAYLLMPLYHDALRIQAIELNDEIRRSGYSFQLTGTRLRLFPVPSENIKLWFDYTLDTDGIPMDSPSSMAGLGGKITDISNIPYQNLEYRFINQLGRQWIRKYCLAIVKEMLGYVRAKYQSIPIPDGEISMNGADLISAAQTEKEALVSDLKEMLDQMSFQSQLERKTAAAKSLNEQLGFIPLKIYVM